jgi:hypothetical protein
MAKAKSLTVIAEEKIVNQIHLIRGQKVMLDSDLAALYGVETKRLKEQVNRNLSRFPKHYMFELTKEEYDNFTEHGILMLANVLKSARAIEMSIKVIDIFVKLREMLLTHTDILLKLELLEKQVVKNSGEIQTIFSVLKQLLNPQRESRRRIGFKPDN